MDRKRLVIGIGLFATAIALVTCVKHCLRAMSKHGAAHQQSRLGACNPADCILRSERDQHQEAAALAA
jgi:hypothetical protein